MESLLLVAAAGFAASMVDGALGMGFGPTSSSILLSGGMAPSAVSATVNIAKAASGAAAGISHWRLGNIDRRLVVRLALPGCAGALLGVTLLARVDGKELRPWLAVMLIAVGVRILFRFRKPLAVAAPSAVGASATAEASRGAEFVAAAGGVTNGLIGAWGPVVTPFLLHRGVPPRVTVGSVNTAEVAVAAASLGALGPALASGALELPVVAAMLIGGVAGAPLAAWVVRLLPPRAMGIAVAALLLLTNVRELAVWGGVGELRWALYAAVLGVAGAVGAAPVLRRSLAPSA
ncbi:MAG: sulfite exporter TauE/SafE family protein [Acidimicrobiales bacterium]